MIFSNTTTFCNLLTKVGPLQEKEPIKVITYIASYTNVEKITEKLADAWVRYMKHTREVLSKDELAKSVMTDHIWWDNGQIMIHTLK